MKPAGKWAQLILKREVTIQTSTVTGQGTGRVSV